MNKRVYTAARQRLKRASFFMAVIGGLVFSGCKDDEKPNYPVEPHIEFVSTEVNYDEEHSNGLMVDELRVIIRYRDGDADLGLLENLWQFPYHEATYFKREPPHDTVLDLNSYQGELLQLGDKPGGLDTLPEFEKNARRGEDCINYLILSRPELNDDGEFIPNIDTVYRQLNLNFFNFFMEAYVKENGGYQYFDFHRESCIPLHGRFNAEITESWMPFRLVKSSEWEGSITFSYQIPDLSEYFGGDSIKLKIYIKDRNLNKSNVVETPVLYIKK